MGKNRMVRIMAVTGALLIVLLIVIFLKTAVSRKQKETDGVQKEALFQSGEGTGEAVYFDENGKRVIAWDQIQVPEWIERDLLPVNQYSRPGEYLEDINGVVVHYTANPGTTAVQNRNYFEGLADGKAGIYASSHFIIDADGSIVQCVPMSEVAYASNERNCDTISIECCHEDETGKLTEATYQSLVKLTGWIVDTYKIETDQVIRHYDVTGKICPKYYVDHPDKWKKFLKEIDRNR